MRLLAQRSLWVWLALVSLTCSRDEWISTPVNSSTRNLVSGIDLTVINVTVFQPKYNSTGNGNNVTLRFEVYNQGMQDCNSAFSTSVNANGGMTYFTTTSLKSNESTYFTLSYPTTGTVTFSINADYNNVVAESNESNNTASTSANIQTPARDRWFSIGPTKRTGGLPDSAGGKVTAFAIQPNNNQVIYATNNNSGGDSSAGIWKTSNGGATWIPFADGLPTQVFYATAVDPATQARVYAQSDRGIYISQDATTTSASWKLIPGSPGTQNMFPNSGRTGHMVIDPVTPNVVYVLDATSVQKSTNYGSTWTPVLGPSTGCKIVSGEPLDLQIDPSNHNRLWATFRTSNALTNGIYQSTDGFATCKKLTGCDAAFPTTANQFSHVSRTPDGHTYATFVDASGMKLFRHDPTAPPCSSDPTEDTWVSYFFSTGGAETAGVYAVNSGNVFTWAHSGGAWYSHDYGATFTPTDYAKLHADEHALVPDPSALGVVYMSTDGGIYKSTDGGVNWTFVSEGMSTVQFWDIALSVTNPTKVVGGAQDVGNLIYDGTSTVWTDGYDPGDGGQCAIDPTNENVVYWTYQDTASIRQSVNGGYSPVNDMHCGLPAYPACQYSFFQVDPTNTNQMLAPCGANGLYKGTPSVDCPTNAFSKVTTISGPSFSTTHVDPDNHIYYVGTGDGRIQASTDLVTWQAQPLSFGATNWVQQIETDPWDRTNVYVILQHNGTGRVWYLKRSGLPPNMSFTTAVDIGATLGDGGAYQPWSLVVDHPNNSIYVGFRNYGVWRATSSNGGSSWSWSPYNDGFPAASNILNLFVHPSSGRLRAGTFGRGVFEVVTDYLFNLHWYGWNTISGGEAYGWTGTASPFSGESGNVYAFEAQASPNPIYWTKYNGSSWSSWQTVSTASTIAMPATTAFTTSGTPKVWLFYTASNNHIFFAYWTGVRWTVPQEVPGGGTTDSNPAVAIDETGSDSTHALYLLVKGIGDKRLYWQRMDATGAFSGSWALVNGSPQFSSGPAATNIGRTIYVFETGLISFICGSIYSTTWTPAAGWSGSWSTVPNGCSATQPAAAYDSQNGAIYVTETVIGPNYSIVPFKVAANAWGDWKQFTDLTAANVVPGLAYAAGKLWIFGTASNGGTTYNTGK